MKFLSVGFVIASLVFSPILASAAERGGNAGQMMLWLLGIRMAEEPKKIDVNVATVDELRAVLAEPVERIVEVVHREHHAEVAERVDRRVPVIGDRRRREKAREFDLAVAVRHTHHGDLDALVAQSSDAP